MGRGKREQTSWDRIQVSRTQLGNHSSAEGPSIGGRLTCCRFYCEEGLAELPQLEEGFQRWSQNTGGHSDLLCKDCLRLLLHSLATKKSALPDNFEALSPH